MHENSIRRKKYAVLAALTIAACVTPAVSAQELPGDAETPAAAEHGEGSDADLSALMDRIGQLSEQTTAKSEELKAKQDELDKANEELHDLEGRAAAAGADADSAADAAAQQREAVKKLAGSRYRGVNFDSVTAALSSGDPQVAAERLGYLGALSRSARASLSTMNRTAEEASETHSDAEHAAELAAQKRDGIERDKARLEREAKELDRLKEEVEKQVDDLSAEQRAAWENRLNPVRPDDVKVPTGGDLSSVVAAALSKQGAPYGWGAQGPDTFDCSGLMLWAYSQAGKSIPRTSQAQIAGGTPVPIDKLEPGDIVGYYPGVTHVGMYIGNGQVVHASDYGIPVQVVPLNSMPITGTARY